jgi:NAD(P)H-dependent FMN reductase
MQNVQIILGSTRPQRQGEKVARWITSLASQYEEIQAEYIDLRDWPLPFFSESSSSPEHYSAEIVPTWIQKVKEGDAYIFVTPEYNHGSSAVLKNALDYGSDAWFKKPAAFVGYSGDIGGGIRAVEQLRLISISLQMAPITEAIYIPVVWRQFNQDGQMINPVVERKVKPFFEQLIWWSRVLQQARQQELVSVQ